MHPAVVRCDAHADFLGAIKELAKTSSGANELNVSRTIDEVYLFIRLMADEFSRRNVGSAVPTAAQWAAITAVRSYVSHGKRFADDAVRSGCITALSRLAEALVVALSSSSASVFPEAPPRLLVLSLQALGNVSVHAPEAVFSACTGETRCWVACTSTASPAILGPVAMAVYNCARRIGPHPADVLCPLTSEILPGLISSFSAAHRHRLQEAPAGTSRSPDSHDSAAAPSLSDHAVAERVQEGEAAHQTHVEGTEWLALLLLHLALMPKADGTARSGVEGEGQADGVVEEKGGFAGERARVGVGGVLRSLPGEDAVFALELMAEEMDSNSGHWSSKARSPPPSLGHDLSALLDGALSRGDTAFLHGVLALARAVLSTAADGDGGTAIDEHNNDGEAGATAKTMAEENGHAGVASGRPSKDEREGTASGIQRLPGTLAGHWAAETGLIRSVLRVLRRLGLPPPPETRKGREGGGSGGGGRGGGEEREKGGRDADEGERGEGRASQGECGEGREGGQAGRGSHLRGNSEMEGPMRSVGCAEQPPWAYYGCRTDALACLACASYRCPEVAAEVEREGMVELVLAQCQVDDHSPLAREWGLFAVRNLCEVSAGIRDRISNLKAQGVVESRELDRLGLRVEIDPESGKVKVQKTETQ